MRRTHALFGVMLLLAGCGRWGASGSAGVSATSVSVPAAFAGTWGADCASPFVTFTPGLIHVYPDDADYQLQSVSPSSNAIAVGYQSKAGAVVETYEMEGDMIRLTRGTYSGQEATWDKAPMAKCR